MEAFASSAIGIPRDFVRPSRRARSMESRTCQDIRSSCLAKIARPVPLLDQHDSSRFVPASLWSRSLADDPAAPNRATVAGLDAKLDGLKDLVRAETGQIQRQLDAVAGLPVRVATLEANLAALDNRETESDTDIDRRVTELEQRNEQRNSRMSNQRWALIVAVVGSLVVDLASRIHIP